VTRKTQENANVTGESTMKRRFLLAAMAVSSTLGLLIFCFPQCEVADGGMPQVLFRIRIIDKRSQPTKNVAVTVTDNCGQLAYWYPVPDFRPDREVVSGDDGIVEFHHITCMETTIRRRRWMFGVLQKSTVSEPSYDVNLSINNTIVGRFRINDYFGLREALDKSEFPKVVIEKSLSSVISPDSLDVDQLFSRFRVKRDRLREKEKFAIVNYTFVWDSG
jgi:hypothetical protein